MSFNVLAIYAMLKVKVSPTSFAVESSGLFGGVLMLAWIGFVLILGFVSEDLIAQSFAVLISLASVSLLFLGSVEEKPPFRCPDCKGDVEPPLKTEGERVPLFSLCKPCDVLWHMGYSPTKREIAKLEKRSRKSWFA